MEEEFHARVSEPLDVHRLARAEVDQRLAGDRRTALVDTADRALALEFMQRLAAFGTVLRRLERLRAARALDDFDDLRDDLAALLHHHRRADADVEARDLVEV